MSESVRPQRQQPTRLPRPWDSPGKNTGVGCHFLLQWESTHRLHATSWPFSIKDLSIHDFGTHQGPETNALQIPRATLQILREGCEEETSISELFFNQPYYF